MSSPYFMDKIVPIYNKGTSTYIHGGVEVRPGRIYKMKYEDARALWKLFPHEIVLGDPANEPIELERELKQLQEKYELLRVEMNALVEHKIYQAERQKPDLYELSGKLGRKGKKVNKEPKRQGSKIGKTTVHKLLTDFLQ